MDARTPEQSEILQPRPLERPSTFFERANDFARTAYAAAQKTRATIKERNLTRPILMIGGPALVALVAGYYWLTGGRYVSTDDAYVHAAKLMVSAEVSGVVSEVDIHEGQAVKAGDVLFKIDRKPFEIALANAKANLANTGLSVNSMKQDYRRMLGDIEAQRAQVALAQSNLNRIQPLLKKRFVAPAAYDNARFGLDAEQKKLTSLQETANAQLAKLGGDENVDPTTHPQYLQAKAAVDEAQRQLDHTIVRAPFDGVVTQSSGLQRGVYIVSSMAAFSNTAAVGLVSTDHLWIDANLKETDLTYVKAGDPVDVTIDTYPGRTWTAKVESIGAASGAEFSLLPSTNSSGNWTKVVQRIPVRVAIERKSDDPTLRPGMSATVEIDTGHSRSISEIF